MKQIEKGSSQADSWDKPSRLKKNNVETSKIGKKIIFFKIVYIIYILIFPAGFEKWVIF